MVQAAVERAASLELCADRQRFALAGARSGVAARVEVAGPKTRLDQCAVAVLELLA